MAHDPRAVWPTTRRTSDRATCGSRAKAFSPERRRSREEPCSAPITRASGTGIRAASVTHPAGWNSVFAPPPSSSTAPLEARSMLLP